MELKSRNVPFGVGAVLVVGGALWVWSGRHKGEIAATASKVVTSTPLAPEYDEVPELSSEESARKLELLRERLGLDPGQTERVRDTMATYQEQLAALKSAAAESEGLSRDEASRRERREKMSALAGEVMHDLSSILSEDQLRLYQSLDLGDQIVSGSARFQSVRRVQ